MCQDRGVKGLQIDKINEHTAEFVVRYSRRGTKGDKRRKRTLRLAVSLLGRCTASGLKVT